MAGGEVCCCSKGGGRETSFGALTLGSGEEAAVPLFAAAFGGAWCRLVECMVSWRG